MSVQQIIEELRRCERVQHDIIRLLVAYGHRMTPEEVTEQQRRAHNLAVSTIELRDAAQAAACLQIANA